MMEVIGVNFFWHWGLSKYVTLLCMCYVNYTQNC